MEDYVQGVFSTRALVHTKQLSILGDIDFSDNGPGKTKVLAKVGIILTQSQLIFVTGNS